MSQGEDSQASKSASSDSLHRLCQQRLQQRVFRFALTIPQEGGSSGPGCWRIIVDMKKNGANVEDAVQIVKGDRWFATQFPSFVDNIGTIPHDHHILEFLVAFRRLPIIANSGIDYLEPVSTYGCPLAGARYFEA